MTEYAVQNFSYVPAGFDEGVIQANYTDIQIFMDVTRSFMESVDWVEKYFWFGAMYEMVRHNFHSIEDGTDGTARSQWPKQPV